MSSAKRQQPPTGHQVDAPRRAPARRARPARATKRAAVAAATEGRVARRRAGQRRRIMAVAAEHFAAQGLDAVRLDEIADAADLARGTLYSHFPSKEALVVAIVRPALELAASEAEAIGECEAREGIERVVLLYLHLWREHADALRISHRLEGMPIPGLAEVHPRIVMALMRTMQRAATAGILRVRDPSLAVLVIARLAVPLLELYGSHPERDRLFGDSLRGLLVAD